MSSFACSGLQNALVLLVRFLSDWRLDDEFRSSQFDRVQHDSVADLLVQVVNFLDEEGGGAAVARRSGPSQ